jgi:septum formation protein
MSPTLILASSSPRRRSQLAQAGMHPEIRVADIDEQPRPDEEARPYASRMAREKALAVAIAEGELVLAADTVVHRDATLFGKPVDASQAVEMLTELSGCWHQVSTAFVLRQDGVLDAVEVVTTRVRFRDLSRADIERYVASGEPLDKAGAYGIQGQGGVLVERIDGSYSNVVGLPMAELVEELLRLAVITPESD